MADIADELKTYLGGVAAISAIVGQRIFNNRSRQARPTPFLVLEEVEGEVIDVLFKDSGFVQSTFNVYATADEISTANNLGTEVRRNLHTFSGQMGSVWVQEVAMPLGRYRSTRTIYKDHNNDAFFFESRQQFDIWHSTPRVVI